MHKDFRQSENNAYIKKSRKDLIDIDADTALVTALILILKKEKGDILLILALLYILT